MSSTGSLRRTEQAPLSAAFTRDGIATAVAALLFTVILVSFRPFQPAGAELTGEGGDIVNQLGFGSLGAISILSLLTLADRRVVRSLLSPSWLLMLGFFMLSVILARLLLAIDRTDDHRPWSINCTSASLAFSSLR